MSERVTEITPVEFDNKIGDSQYNQMESILVIDQKNLEFFKNLLQILILKLPEN